MKKITSIITEANQDTESTESTGLYTLISKLYSDTSEVKPEAEPEAKPEVESLPSGLYSLISTKSNFQPTGTNTVKLSNGENFTYNDLSFDKSLIKYNAPLEIIKGWYVERDSIQSISEYKEQIKVKLNDYEANKNNPKKKIKKPCLDRHTIIQADTEFSFLETPTHLQEVSDLLFQENRNHLTSQIKFLPVDGSSSPNLIFATKEFSREFNPLLKSKGYQTLPVLKERDCDVFDYLNLVTSEKWEVSTAVNDNYLQSIPKLFLTIAAHNAEAEINLIFHGQLLRRIIQLQSEYSLDEGIIKQSKVVKCFSNITKFAQKISVDWVSLKAIVNIDGVAYHLCLRIIDTIKAHGIVSLGNFSKASGYKLSAKDFLSKSDKESIRETFLSRPEDSIAYALGDTCNLEIQYAFGKMLSENIYPELKLSNFLPPSLTIGRTVADLDFASIAECLEFKSEEWEKLIKQFVENEMQPYSPSKTIKFSTHSSAILAKGFGGRIGQNQPSTVKINRQPKLGLRDFHDVGGKFVKPEIVE